MFRKNKEVIKFTNLFFPNKQRKYASGIKVQIFNGDAIL